MRIIFKICNYIFSRKIFYKFNNLGFLLNLNALGILNYDNFNVSGENNVLRFIGNYYVDKEPLLIDVGANIGDYSLLLKKFVPNAKIISFEPNPKTYDFLKKNTKGKHILLENLGLSDKRGNVNFYDKSVRSKNGATPFASVYKDVIEKNHKSVSMKMKIKMDTLDNYLYVHNIKKINYLKIDTEGHEYSVLKGAKRCLHNIDFIQFEFNEMNVYSRVFFKDFWDLLNKDFVLYRMLPNEFLEIKNYIPLNCEIFAFQNIFCIRKTLINSIDAHYV